MSRQNEPIHETQKEVLENFSSNIKEKKKKFKKDEKMTLEDKNKSAKKKSWLEFVKAVVNHSKLFHDKKPKTEMLCNGVNYRTACDLVANEIYSTVFLSKRIFEQAEETENFEFNFMINGK